MRELTLAPSTHHRPQPRIDPGNPNLAFAGSQDTGMVQYNGDLTMMMS